MIASQSHETLPSRPMSPRSRAGAAMVALASHRVRAEEELSPVKPAATTSLKLQIRTSQKRNRPGGSPQMDHDRGSATHDSLDTLGTEPRVPQSPTNPDHKRMAISSNTSPTNGRRSRHVSQKSMPNILAVGGGRHRRSGSMSSHTSPTSQTSDQRFSHSKPRSSSGSSVNILGLGGMAAVNSTPASNSAVLPNMHMHPQAPQQTFHPTQQQSNMMPLHALSAAAATHVAQAQQPYGYEHTIQGATRALHTPQHQQHFMQQQHSSAQGQIGGQMFPQQHPLHSGFAMPMPQQHRMMGQHMGHPLAPVQQHMAHLRMLQQFQPLHPHQPQHPHQAAYGGNVFRGMYVAPGAHPHPMQSQIIAQMQPKPPVADAPPRHGRRKATPWTEEEDRRLVAMVKQHGPQNWRTIANGVGSRTPAQVAQRWRKTLNPELVKVNKGKWTKEEDDKLRALIAKHSDKNWQAISDGFDGTRTVKHCRERWLKHISPDLKHNEPWTVEEDNILLRMREQMGYNGWAEIARSLPGRTDNAVKRRYRSLTRLGGTANAHAIAAGHLVNSGLILSATK
mmetsp:Transcript_55589/g.82328  ORF Transcript_55589/g.82328 Transcript_55589/m.82328 type:complete len:563 (+) Transcript_55589:153-1841(+)